MIIINVTLLPDGEIFLKNLKANKQICAAGLGMPNLISDGKHESPHAEQNGSVTRGHADGNNSPSQRNSLI